MDPNAKYHETLASFQAEVDKLLNNEASKVDGEMDLRKAVQGLHLQSTIQSSLLASQREELASQREELRAQTAALQRHTEALVSQSELISEVKQMMKDAPKPQLKPKAVCRGGATSLVHLADGAGSPPMLMRMSSNIEEFQAE
eukprot:2668941-Prymnesium_polylepis.1